jgi:hypothetical protein
MWPCAEVLVFGSGPSIRPPAPELVKSLQAQGIGLEVSNTVRLHDPIAASSAAQTFSLDTWLSAGVLPGAIAISGAILWGSPHKDSGWPAQVNAIATFNILAQEGRHVVGAFVPMTTET